MTQETTLNIMAVIPAFNEEKSIAEVVSSTKQYVSSVIVIDDGSSDATSDKAKSAGAIVIRNDVNLGKGEALRKGILECIRSSADIVVTIDADGQHDPHEIPKVIRPIADNKAAVVIGSRYLEANNIPIHRQFGLSIIGFLAKYVAGINVTDSQSGFRAYSKGTLRELCNYESRGYGVESEQLAIAAANDYFITEVPVQIKYGIENSSKKNFLSHGNEIALTILKIAYQKRPALFLGIPGLGLIATSTLVAALLSINSYDVLADSGPLTIILGIEFLGLGFLYQYFRRRKASGQTRNYEGKDELAIPARSKTLLS